MTGISGAENEYGGHSDACDIYYIVHMIFDGFGWGSYGKSSKSCGCFNHLLSVEDCAMRKAVYNAFAL